MKIFGGISVSDDAMSESIRGMRSGMKMLNLITNNITRFNQVGYQRKNAVKTSFSEYIGSHGVDAITDTQPGRMTETGNPLDIIIEQEGYFQIQGKNGIKLSRDGRFQIDKDGFLTSLENEKILGNDGEAIRFHQIPGDLKDITVDQDGTINLYNRAYKSKERVGKLGIASQEGLQINDITVAQGFTEASNVNLAQEFFQMLPVRRNFEANKQAFILTSGNVDKLLQMLGRSS